jgi:hypothetical protein
MPGTVNTHSRKQIYFSTFDTRIHFKPLHHLNHTEDMVHTGSTRATKLLGFWSVNSKFEKLRKSKTAILQAGL